jgi:hypothetical protein
MQLGPNKSTQMINLANRMHFSTVCTLIDDFIDIKDVHNLSGTTSAAMDMRLFEVVTYFWVHANKKP